LESRSRPSSSFTPIPFFSNFFCLLDAGLINKRTLQPSDFPAVVFLNESSFFFSVSCFALQSVHFSGHFFFSPQSPKDEFCATGRPFFSPYLWLPSVFLFLYMRGSFSRKPVFRFFFFLTISLFPRLMLPRPCYPSTNGVEPVCLTRPPNQHSW